MPGVDGGGESAVPLDQWEGDGREGAQRESEGWANPDVGWCGRGGVDEGCLLFPKIAFVPGHLVFFEKLAELVLKREFSVMFFLAMDVFLNGFQHGWTDGEDAKAGLPCEPCHPEGIFVFEPKPGDSFQFLDPIGLGYGAVESGEDMHMVCDAADDDGRAIEFIGDIAEEGVGFVLERAVEQPGFAVLGGEDGVQIDGGERLRHGGGVSLEVSAQGRRGRNPVGIGELLGAADPG